MNIKNLFLFVLVITGLLACSSNGKDDLDIPEKGEGVLVINLSPQGGMTTRAGSDAAPVKAWPGESAINSYYVLICDDNGKVLQKLINADGGATVRSQAYTAGTSLQIYAFVNLSEEAVKNIPGANDPVSLNTIQESLGSQKQSGLTMASTGVTLHTVTEGTNNVDVPITRLASRVQISEIHTDFDIANDYTVQINSLTLKNVKENSYLFRPVTGDNTAEVKDEAARWTDKEMIAINPVTVSNAKPVLYVMDGSIAAETNGKYPAPYGYTFENTVAGQPTQLVLNATLLDAGHKEVSTRNFTVTINQAGNPSFVRRNYIYNLVLTFNDNSFDMAVLVVKTTIVPWGSVHQAVEVD